MSYIINPEFKTITNNFMHCTNAVKCNKSANVDRHIRSGVKYVFELPGTNEILNVICTFKGTRAADMQILSHVIDGKTNPDEEQYTFSYVYDTYNKIHFKSFKYYEVCDVYVSVDDVII